MSSEQTDDAVSASAPIGREITRDDLHKLVWKSPLRTLAESFGVSDVALAKVCRKLNVPVPGRGHWAKVAAGATVATRPLPRTAKQHVAVIGARQHPLPKEDERPAAAIVEDVGTITVPAVIEQPHPLTVKTRAHFRDIQRRIERHAKRRPGAPYVSGDWPPREDHGRYCGGGDNEGYHLVVSFAALDRALALLDTVTKALGKQGFRFSHSKPDTRGHYQRGPSGLIAEKNGEQFHYYLREGYSQRVRSATELAAARKAGEYPTSREYLPNGSFSFELSGSEYGIARTFRDTRSTKLEGALGTIVATIVDAVSRQKAARDAREADELARREAEHRRWVEAERIRKEKAEVEKLLEEATRAKRFAELREYLDTVERAALRAGGISESGQEWLTESRRLVELYDPMQLRLGPQGDADEDS